LKLFLISRINPSPNKIQLSKPNRRKIKTSRRLLRTPNWRRTKKRLLNRNPPKALTERFRLKSWSFPNLPLFPTVVLASTAEF